MKMPLVSIVMPAYQRAHVIVRAIDSVYSQTFSDWEIVVVDDGSTDETEKVVKSYDDRVRYVKQTNQGPAAARNLGIRHARGEWIAFLDTDDVWLPEKLARQLAILQGDPEIGWAYCDLSYFGSNAANMPATAFHFFPPVRGMALKHIFLYGCAMHTPTIIVKKVIFNAVGGFNESLRIAEDIDLYFRLAANYPVGYDPEVQVSVCRDVRTPVHSKAEKYAISAAVKRRCLEKHPEFLASLSRQELRKGYLDSLLLVVLAALKEGKTDIASAHIDECRRYDNWWLKVLFYRLGVYFPSLFLKVQELRYGK